LTGPGQTLSWARETLQAIRIAARDHNGQVHLFMYTSASAALFLGHIWNRVPATQLYDDNLRGYSPTFTIAG
jgi:SMODS-associated and fused to various effectors sensor domain